MELFSISDDQEAEDNTKFHIAKRAMHPAFLPITFPITHLPKGRKLKYLPQPLFYSLFLDSSVRPVPLVLQVHEEFIYAHERWREFWVVRHTWSLRRLIMVELDEAKPSEMTLVFPNSSLDPGDPLKRKSFDVPDLPGFLLALRTKLTDCDIDLELDEAKGLWVK